MRQPIHRSALSRVTLWTIVVAATFDLVSSVASAQAPPQTEAVMKNMIGAIQVNSLADFNALADQSVKAAMTEQILDKMNQMLGPRLKQGYAVVGMGTLRKEGAQVYLWKLEFKDEGDDVLVTMAMKDGKVTGFYLR
jgi:hypothetical protein